MKTITRILLLGLLLFPMYAFAQSATEQREYEVRVEWEDMQGYSERVKYNVPIYYDDDDNVIKHGPLKINYKHDLTSRVNQKCVIAYTVSGNYVNGKLDGTFSLEKSATVSAGVLKVKGILNFVNGEPDGTWSFTETVTSGNEKGSAKLAIVFKDKKLVSFDINDGKECFTINTDNNTFSGTDNGKVYKNGLNTSEFIRKTGEKTKPDETVANLINGFVAGTISESDIIAKGFGFERSWPWAYYDYSNLRYYISKLMAAHFMDEAQYSSYSSAVHEIEHNNDINPALTLKRGNVKSAEEMIAIANTIKTAEKVTEDTNEINWYERAGGGGEWYNYDYGKNYIVIKNNLYYFTDEAKLKFEEAIKTTLEEKRLEKERIAEEKRLEQERIAEERRLQQERIADERRLQEIEKQRKQIQPICDYLVAQKTPLNICYSEEVGRYFDPAGLSDTWKLDLDKAIKPFCKIAGCTLVSFENGVAVLDITKFNKKGNITYRVPVTIKDGKILVTSISFSNATVVE